MGSPPHLFAPPHLLLERTRRRLPWAVAAVRNAIGLWCPEGTVVHSDRGNQFRSAKLVRLLRTNGLHGSMGRVGACADNAARVHQPAQGAHRRP